MAKKKKLSELLRQGEKKYRSIRYVWLEQDKNGDITHACPLMCLWLEGFPQQRKLKMPVFGRTLIEQLTLYYPEIKKSYENPVTHIKNYLGGILISLDDDYGWSFSQIADWLERMSL